MITAKAGPQTTNLNLVGTETNRGNTVKMFDITVQATTNCKEAVNPSKEVLCDSKSNQWSTGLKALETKLKEIIAKIPKTGDLSNHEKIDGYDFRINGLVPSTIEIYTSRLGSNAVPEINVHVPVVPQGFYGPVSTLYATYTVDSNSLPVLKSTQLAEDPSLQPWKLLSEWCAK